MPTTSRTDYRILQIPNERQADDPHLVLLTLKTEESKDPPFASGTLTVSVHALSHGLVRGGAPLPAYLGAMGGSYSFHGHAEMDEVRVTGGSMQLLAGARGLGIGRHVQNLVLRWLKAQGRDARVHPVFVSSADAPDADARDRRNRFYRGIGLRFRWQPARPDGLARAEGRSFRRLRLSQLTERPNSRPLAELDLAAMLVQLERRRVRAIDARRTAEAARAYAESRLERESHAWRRIARTAWCAAGAAGLVALLLAGYIGHAIH